LEGKTFYQFNSEQQADIIADFYERSSHHQVGTYGPYLPYVDTVRGVAPGEQVIVGIPPGGPNI
jgi:hypothetical protein